MFGAVGDTAPDRWGKTLMRRAKRRRVAAAPFRNGTAEVPTLIPLFV
jgi:hypothetical protein